MEYAWRVLQTVGAASTSVNVVSYVGLAGVWQCVMGNSFERPTETQLLEMEKNCGMLWIRVLLGSRPRS